MVDVAENEAGPGRRLPAPLEPELAPGAPLRELLRLDVLAGAQVVAGATGLDGAVSRLNVMEVPDILPWVRPHELLLTTGYPLRQTPEKLTSLVRDLAGHGLAGLAVKVGRYLDELPPEMLAEADRVGLPVVLLPDGVGFDDVINQVLRVVLERRAAMLARTEEMLKDLVDIVVGGGDLEHVCRGLVEGVRGVAFVTTIDGRISASASTTPGGLESVVGLSYFDRSGRFLVEQEPVGLRHLDDGRSVIVTRVVVGHLDHGRLVVVADERLGPEDVHVVERATAAAALVVTKAEAVATVESKYQADFLRDALAGRAGPPSRIVSHASALGWDLDRPLAVVVAAIADVGDVASLDAEEERGRQQRFTSAWTRAVTARDPRAAVVGFGPEVVAVFGVPRCDPGGSVGTRADGGRADAAARRDGVEAIADPSSVEALSRAVSDFVRSVRGVGGGGRREFSTGVSRIVASVDQLPRAYEQARESVTVGRRMHGAQSVMHFDALGVFRLLSLVPDSTELRSFVAETLGDLADDEAPDAVDLRHTLECLLARNLNVAETARELHFHYNTLRYRIGKLERLLGPFTSDPHLRLTLELALQVRQMRGW